MRMETERLGIYPADRAQMEAAIASAPDAELRAAYSEMLALSLQHPEKWEWYAMWVIERKDGTPVGDLCFKGLDAEGRAEIGYGILEEHQGRGYATEAVKAACAWALENPAVKSLEAETEPHNTASQRVLQKCGFRPTGAFGEEGPRFVLQREAFAPSSNNMITV